jgi:hypothetical protein
MTTRERLFLPTWVKWTKYGKVPWKIIFNVLLVAFVTAKVAFGLPSSSPSFSSSFALGVRDRVAFWRHAGVDRAGCDFQHEHHCSVPLCEQRLLLSLLSC